MPSDKRWIAIEKEFNELRKKKEYEWLKPIFDSIEPMLNVDQNFELAKRFIRIIKYLHDEKTKGHDFQERIDDIKSGYSQPEWLVGGDVYQATRDINTVIQIIQAKADQLKPPSTATEFPMPVVLVVMTESEARELSSKEAFNGQPEQLQTDFDTFNELLAANGITDKVWVKHYQDILQAWQPFDSSAHGQTIRQFVTKAINDLNRDGNYEPKLVPEFKDIHSIHDDRRTLLSWLTTRLCTIGPASSSKRKGRFEQMNRVRT